jgi:hypothetical protein
MLLPGVDLSRVSGLNEPLNAIGHPKSAVLEAADSNFRHARQTFSPCRHDPYILSLSVIISDPIIG